MDPYQQVDEKPSVRLKITMGEQQGSIRLSSVYGSFKYLSSLETPEGEVAEFSCPHCEKLLNTENKCPECEAQLVQFKISDGGKAVICSRSGCKNHNVGYADLHSTLNQFYKRHQYGDRHAQ